MNSKDIPGTVEYVKDFMPLTYQNEIITNLKNMPWYWRPQIAEYSPEIYVDKENPFEDPRVTDAFAFVHVCYEDGNVKSDFYQYFKPILRESIR